MAGLDSRGKFEAMFGRRLGLLAGRHRRELIEMAGDPPDLSKVPPEWFDRVRLETEAELLAILLIIFVIAATAHGADSGQAQSRGLEWATQTARERSTAWAQGTRDAVAKLATVPDLDAATLRDSAGTALGPGRVEGEVITQTTVATSAGSEFAATSAGLVDQRDIWRTEKDAKVCPICRPLDGTARTVWAQKFPSGPPAHPRCRCEIDYAMANLLRGDPDLN